MNSDYYGQANVPYTRSYPLVLNGETRSKYLQPQLNSTPLNNTYLHVFDCLSHNLFGIFQTLEYIVQIGLCHSRKSIKEIHLESRNTARRSRCHKSTSGTILRKRRAKRRGRKRACRRRHEQNQRCKSKLHDANERVLVECNAVWLLMLSHRRDYDGCHGSNRLQVLGRRELTSPEIKEEQRIPKKVYVHTYVW